MKKICAALILALSTTVANASSIDFESVSGTVFSNPILNVDGFDWSFSADGWFIGDPTGAVYPSGTTNGTNILAASGDRSGAPANVVMTKSGGGSFDIGSLYAASRNTEISNTISIVGQLLGGGSVSASIAVGGAFSQYSLSGFTDLVSVQFTSVLSGTYDNAGFALDDFDLSVSAIPVPGSLPLLAVAFGALAYARGRRRS